MKHRRERGWTWFGAAAAAGVAGVSLTYVASCYDFAFNPPGPDGSLPAPDTGDGRPVDAGADSGPPLRSPVQITVHAPRDAAVFGIDTTEVTRAQYAQFLASNPNPRAQITECQWNKSLVPKSMWPDGGARTGNHPVTAVNWCDAYAFCEWAGKRLCGDIRGGAHNFSAVNEDAGLDTDQWRIACTNAEDGKHDFPYGNTYDPQACNGKDKKLDSTVEVASSPKCVGGFPGLFDMSGNANEWENSCSKVNPDAGPEEDGCFFRGGSYVQEQGKLGCINPYYGTRNFINDDVGFRCCSK